MANRKKFQELEFKDSFMFATMMEDPETCREVLERILGIAIKKVVIHSEHTILVNPDQRGVRLDVYADDEEGTIYNVEMQTSSEPDLPKRSRFYQGQMDVAYMKPGTPFGKLPESFVIFICCYDPCGRKRYRYTFQEHCDEDGEPLGDGTYKIFLNTKGENPEEVPPELVRFLKYVDSPEKYPPEDSDVLIDRLQKQLLEVKRNRKTEERYMQFQEMLEKEREIGREEGREIGNEEGREVMAALFNAMSRDGRIEDYSRAANDLEFRKAMLEHYKLI